MKITVLPSKSVLRYINQYVMVFEAMHGEDDYYDSIELAIGGYDEAIVFLQKLIEFTSCNLCKATRQDYNELFQDKLLWPVDKFDFYCETPAFLNNYELFYYDAVGNKCETVIEE